MEKDILNYSPTVMFRGTPCIRICKVFFVFVSLDSPFMGGNVLQDFLRGRVNVYDLGA